MAINDRLGLSAEVAYAGCRSLHAVRQVSRLLAAFSLASARDLRRHRSGAGHPGRRGRQERTRRSPRRARPRAAQRIERLDTMPLPERVGIQFDLAWTGHFNGLINGEFNERTVTAVKAFQKSIGVTRDRHAGAARARPARHQVEDRQERVGWRMVDDKVTGAQVGLPTKQVPTHRRAAAAARAGRPRRARSRSRPSGSENPARRSRTVFEHQKKEPPNRQLEVNLTARQLLHPVGHAGAEEVLRARARSAISRCAASPILYDQATEGIMDPVDGRDVERVRAVLRHRPHRR